MIKAAFKLSLLILITACNCFNPCNPPRLRPKCCVDFRRPQVMCEQADWVTDYNDCCPPTPPCLMGATDLPVKPVTEEMLDPFAAMDAEWTFAAGDTLDISVYGDPEAAAQNVLIAPDGRLYWSIVGGVEAAGKTIKELKEEIGERLAPLYNDPQLIITPRQIPSQGVKILGRVRAPGFYPLLGPTTLREAFSQAGGLISQAQQDSDSGASYRAPYADLASSFLVRGGEKIDIDFESVILEGDQSQNVYLKPGDYIYIHPLIQREVYVLGAINAPQSLEYTPNMTLMGALATVGAWGTPGPYTPDLKRVLVIRGSLECPCVVQIDVMEILRGEALDFYLQPGDILYAQNKTFRLGRELVYIAIEAFVNAFAIGWAGHIVDVHWLD